MKPIPATYESKCIICGSTIYEEDEIVEWEDEWVHAACAEDEGAEVER